jgi:hypothetical protein
MATGNRYLQFTVGILPKEHPSPKVEHAPKLRTERVGGKRRLSPNQPTESTFVAYLVMSMLL